MAENVNRSLDCVSGESEESVEKRKAASAAETGAAADREENPKAEAGNLSEDALASVAGGYCIAVPDPRIVPDQLDEAEIPDGVVGRRFPIPSTFPRPFEVPPQLDELDEPRKP